MVWFGLVFHALSFDFIFTQIPLEIDFHLTERGPNGKMVILASILFLFILYEPGMHFFRSIHREKRAQIE